MTVQDQIDRFLDGRPHAVVGASRRREKYGNKVVRAYRQSGREVLPVNPNAGEVEGLRAYPDLTSLPRTVHGISVITPPEVSDGVVDEALALGIEHIWLQPGAESDAVVERARRAGANVIAGGPCVLVTLRYREE